MRTVADRITSFSRLIPTRLLYPLGLAPGVIIFVMGLTGHLGMEPIKELEHQLGLLGLQFLIASLCISPLRRFFNVNLVRFRRPLGLIGFYYVLCHLLTWLILDVGIPSQIWGDIVKRPYITIGMLGFLLLVPLALTSTDWAIRKLGPLRWRKIHKLVYPAVFLGGVHFLMLVKGWQMKPIIYLTIICALLLMRVRIGRVARAKA